MIRKNAPDLDAVLADLCARCQRPLHPDAVCSFPQVHKGPAGFILSYTTVIFEDAGSRYHVYFDGAYAYTLEHPNDMFLSDLERGALKPADLAYLYQAETPDEP